MTAGRAAPRRTTNTTRKESPMFSTLTRWLRDRSDRSSRLPVGRGPDTPRLGMEVLDDRSLPANATYRVSYTLNGVTMTTDYLNWGAGSSGKGSCIAYWGAWNAATGTN